MGKSAVQRMIQSAAERGLTPIMPVSETMQAYYHAQDIAQKFGLSETRLRKKAREMRMCSTMGRMMMLSAADMVVVLQHVRPHKHVKPKLRQKLIYFLKCGDFIKIGYSNNFNRRIAAIQAITPHEVTVLATVAGNIAMEKELHRQFAKYRHRMEWFRHEGELADYIKSLIDSLAVKNGDG